jgi:hypothetical protein
MAPPSQEHGPAAETLAREVAEDRAHHAADVVQRRDVTLRVVVRVVEDGAEVVAGAYDAGHDACVVLIAVSVDASYPQVGQGRRGKHGRPRHTLVVAQQQKGLACRGRHGKDERLAPALVSSECHLPFDLLEGGAPGVNGTVRHPSSAVQWAAETPRWINLPRGT